MKKRIVLLSFLLGATSGIAQNIDSLFYAGQDTTGLAQEIAAEEAAWTWTDTLIEGNYDKVDNDVHSMKKKYRNIPDLANDINLKFSTDEEKIRAIFIWMTLHISFDYVEFESRKWKIGCASYRPGTPKNIIANKWEKIYFRYATGVLRKKRGICEGYATLFYELCRYTNINCQMVMGFADDNIEKINKYKNGRYVPTNHAWNDVQLNGEWLFIDVTWASTGIYNGKWEAPKGYSPYYYLVKESNLYPDHVVNFYQTVRRNEIVGNN